MASNPKPLFAIVIEVLNDSALYTDPMLVKALCKISCEYVKTYAEDIPFDISQFRYGYLYLYFVSHVVLVEQFLTDCYRHCEEMQRWMGCLNHTLEICSIGGGPGTDIFGVHRFLENQFIKVNIEGTVLDKYTVWKEAFLRLAYKIDERLTVKGKVKYCYCDFGKTNVVELSSKAIANANLVMLVRFVSAAQQRDGTLYRELEEIFKLMDPGALVIYADNDTNAIMQQAGKASGLRNLVEKTLTWEIPDSEKSLMKMHTPYFNYSPQFKVRLTLSLWKKENSWDNEERLSRMIK